MEKPKGKLVLQTLAMPAHANPNGDIFGGWIMSQMDLGAGIAAKRCSHSRVVTIAVDSMVFKRPVAVGNSVHVYANIIKVGNTSMRIEIEVYAQSWDTDNMWKVTEAIFTFVAIDVHGNPQTVKH